MASSSISFCVETLGVVYYGGTKIIKVFVSRIKFVDGIIALIA